ncbi:MAG TPA: bleomycin resistance protein [Solirubrobacteraceae bacterium]|nr:bleomycin resistance protein [Solirubrobacteraceae bacterium]
MNVPELAELLRETAEHHDAYEKTHGPHDWWDWYAPYLDARQRGESSEAAVETANRYMDETRHIPKL